MRWAARFFAALRMTTHYRFPWDICDHAKRDESRSYAVLTSLHLFHTPELCVPGHKMTVLRVILCENNEGCQTQTVTS